MQLRDGRLVSREPVAVSARMTARAGVVQALGLRPIDHRSGIGRHVPVHATGRTQVPGVWAAGNVTDLAAQVDAAAAAGAAAAAQINMDLVTEQTLQAVACTAAGRQAGPTSWGRRSHES